MGKYCRYCGKKMSDPRDKFCYSCRKPGTPVDFFYRFAKKVDMDEDEIDAIRGSGKNLTLGALIFGLLPTYILIECLRRKADDPTADYVILIVIVILAVLLIYAVNGVGLMLLNKRFVNRNWKINVIVLFFALFTRSRRAAIYIDYIKNVLTHLADEEKSAPKAKEPDKPTSGWKCHFCGYQNPSNRMDCKSCGKMK